MENGTNAVKRKMELADGADKASKAPKAQMTDSDEKDDEILAIQALGQLRNGSNEVLDEDDDDDEFYDTNNDIDALTTDTMNSTGFFMRNLKAHPLYNSALKAYRINKPTIKYGVEMMEKAAIPMVNIMEQKRLEWKRKKRLKRANSMFPDEAKFLPYSSFLLTNTNSKNLPSISEALLLGNKNLNEFSLNLSIESKKRIATCLQLLMLANKQLASKIQHLKELITKEQNLIDTNRKDELIDDNDHAVQIKQDIVTTVKKVVSLISKYAGNSLPEPARSNVRQTLLRLPTRWASSTTDPLNQPSTSPSISLFNTNGRVLVLANESLEMVGSIMNVFDETLNKAELWVKQKQEKQLSKIAILNNLQQNAGAGPGASTSSSQTGSSQQLQDQKEQLDVQNNSRDIKSDDELLSD